MANSLLYRTDIFQISTRLACCALLAATVSARTDDAFLGRPSSTWTQGEALQVLNDSAWAHIVTTTMQEAQCGKDNPAFPTEDAAAGRDDAISKTPTAAKPSADQSEYVIRLNSVKPVQEATQRLSSLDQLTGYRSIRFDQSAMQPSISISVILKRRAAGGASFLEYAFGGTGEAKRFPADGIALWPCAGIRTVDGTSYATLAGLGTDEDATAINFWFPSVANGKQVISRVGEKVVFRFIADRHVFETTFEVDPQDLVDARHIVLATAIADQPRYKTASQSGQ